MQHRLRQRQQIEREKKVQGGSDEMHDRPSRVNKLLFDSCDDIVREPDAIEGAREIEAATIEESRRAQDDGDFEVVDEVRRLEGLDMDPI